MVCQGSHAEPDFLKHTHTHTHTLLSSKRRRTSHLLRMSQNKPHVLFSSLCVENTKSGQSTPNSTLPFLFQPVTMGNTQQLPPCLYQSAVNGCRTFRSSKNNLRQLNHGKRHSVCFLIWFPIGIIAASVRKPTLRSVSHETICPALFNVVLSTNPIDHTLSWWLDGEESICVKVRRTFEHFN